MIFKKSLDNLTLTNSFFDITFPFTRKEGPPSSYSTFYIEINKNGKTCQLEDQISLKKKQ